MSDFDPYNEYDETTWDEWDADCQHLHYEDGGDYLDEDYLDQWDPAVTPPSWYTCRMCNGNGTDPYEFTCQNCNGSGYRSRLAFWIRSFSSWLKCTFTPHYCPSCRRVYFSAVAYCPNADCKSHDDVFPF